MSSHLPIMPEEQLARIQASSPGDALRAGFGALLTERGSLPLESMDVAARIDGLLSRITVRQVFVNSLDQPLEATYVFPLPDRAAVTGFRMEVAGRVIEGVLEERGKAREHYDQAIASGRRAAIAEEDRPGVFNLRVGNVMPGERAAVELKLCGVLPYSDGEGTFRFPLVVAPRYIPGAPLPGPCSGDGTALDTNAVPDASRISPPVLLAGFPNPVRLSLEVELHDGGAGIGDLRCSLHSASEERGQGGRLIRLLPGERLDRDFILRFRLGDNTIRSTLTLHPDAADANAGTFALTLVPPEASPEKRSRPRAVVFLLDRSGSMQGWKIVAARRAIARMIDTLCDDDLFRLIAFDDRCESPPGLEQDRDMAQASDRNRFQAVEFLAGLGARGGTEIAQPLDRAVALLAKQSSEDRDRILVLVTDGQVGNEDQVLQTLGRRLKGIRVFTLGIDQAVNEGFLRRLAERGGGACELVESEERLDEVMESVHRRIGTPILKGLHLEGQGISIEPGEIVPRRLPDLFSGSPLVFLGRYRGRALPSLRVSATDTAGSAWSDRISGTVRDNPAIACAWARGQIRQLEDSYASGDGDRRALERAIIALSLKYQVLCRFTAYVAIDRSQALTPGGSLHRIIQPVDMPAGWGAPVERVEIACASLRAPDAFSRCLAAPPQRLADLSSASSSTLTSSGQVFRLAQFADRSSQIDASVTRPRDPDPDTVAARPSAPSGDSYSLPPRFEHGHQVASGAMGRVYKAFDRDRGRMVLVKVNPANRFDPDVLERWKRESEELDRVAHPALVSPLEFGCSEGSSWVVLPFLEGQTLAARLRSGGPMPFREAAELLAELAEALELAHRRGLVHGDLKPHYILLTNDGRAHFVGFGELPLRSIGSQSNRFIGTPAYMAPERVRGEVGLTDAHTEVYSLGVVLYEALTGKTPYTGSTVKEIFEQILYNTPAPPRQWVRSIPVKLEAIVLKAIARDPDARFATAGELAAALRGFLKPPRRKAFWKSKG